MNALSLENDRDHEDQGPAFAPARSFRGRTWLLPTIDRDRVKGLIEVNVPAAVAPVLAARGFDADDARNYLEPSLRNLLPNPSSFVDMDKAVDRLVRAVREEERIAIWGDYDVDGATSAAVLARFLAMLGITASIHIPDRIEEGYGPNVEGFERLRREGHSLVCVLDSGTVAFEPIARAAGIGLDVIVIDHHAAEQAVPAAVAVVNPNRLDQAPGYGHICAAGMTFLFCVGVNAALRDTGWYRETGQVAELMSLLDLVALGTVADVVPLTGINRAFVRRGLEVMNTRRNPGLATLAKVADLHEEVAAHHCGFVLGPRINAGGRVGAADAGARLLSSEDPVECQDLAEQLNAWNAERRELEKLCTEEAMAQIEAAGGAGPIAFALSACWHPGVIGIAASRLKEAYDRPAFVFAAGGEQAVGSGRGVRGFDLGAAIMAARREGILVKGGGHAMAGGATVELSHYADFIAFMNEQLASSEFARTGVQSQVDMLLPVERVSVGLIDALVAMEPYGQGNSRPRFVITGAQLVRADLLKEAHLRIELGGAGSRRLKGIAFNVAGSPLCDGLLASVGRKIDVLGTLDVNEWNGSRSAQILLDDARLA